MNGSNAVGAVYSDTVAFACQYGEVTTTIHAEKEILMLVVEKEIRDRVLHALYKKMGMGQEAQGIVFSLPVSDAAGLAKAPEDPTE